MSELHLGSRESTDFGARYGGTVETADRTIHISYIEPAHPDLTGAMYAMANNLGASRASMNLPAQEAARANNGAILFDYTNTGTADALSHNTDDFVAVLDALPAELKVRAIGLSMGGVVVTRGAARTDRPLESITTVASAGFIPSDAYGWLKVAQGFAATAPELTNIIATNPLGALPLGVATLQHCARRVRAVKAELQELVHCDEHDTIQRIKAAADAPYLRFMFGDGDPLLPAWAQEAAARDLPFDSVLPYHGGHLALIHDREISQTIFALDAELFDGQAALVDAA